MKSSLSSMIHRLTSDRGRVEGVEETHFDHDDRGDHRADPDRDDHPVEPWPSPGPNVSGPPPVPVRAQQQPMSAAAARGMDVAGQQSEATRAGIAQIANRLEELDSLRTDFQRLIQPVVGLIDEFPSVQAKLADANALLDDERKYSRQLRQELSELSISSGRTHDELVGARSQLGKFEANIEGLEALLGEVRLEFKDRDLVAAELEKQLVAESERARAFADENQMLRQEAHDADQALTRMERDLQEARGQLELLEHDNKLLRSATDDQLERHGVLSSRHAELGHRYDTMRNTYTELQTRLTSEIALREKAEQQREGERSTLLSQTSALEMKLEGLSSRLTVAEKILGTTRDQLREANDAVRLADRRTKEAVIERNNFERRAAALQGDAQRQVAQIGDLEKTRLELVEQTEMLKKAMAAKDAQIEQADARTSGLTQRIDDIVKRSETERGQLEAKTRRLLEELQEERSERALARGALDAARDSRNRLQGELLAFKKGHPSGVVASAPADNGELHAETPAEPAPAGNVTRLRSDEPEPTKNSNVS